MSRNLVANLYTGASYEVLGGVHTADGGTFVNVRNVANGECRFIREGELQDSWYALCEHFYGSMDTCPSCDQKNEQAEGEILARAIRSAY